MARTTENSVKEYIGARYVPLFYDDGHGGAQWTNTVEYEPLTIVVYEGNSFTSRQYVPVGVSINDTRYWLETGNWNSQIEQYRQEVLSFDGRITTAQTTAAGAATAAAAAQTTANTANTAAGTAQTTADGAVAVNNVQNARLDALEREAQITDLVTIGDSWADGWNGTETITPWETYTRAALGNPTMYTNHQGGAGFWKVNQYGNNFQSLMEELANGMTEEQRLRVKYVLIAGGVNDATAADYNDVRSAVFDCCVSARNLFANAKVYVAGISLMGLQSYTNVANMQQILTAYQHGCAGGGAGYITNSEFIAVSERWDSTRTHLQAYTRLGIILAGGLISGSVDIHVEGRTRLYPLTGNTITKGAQTTVRVHNNYTQFEIGDLFFTFDTALSVDYGTRVQIASWNSTLALQRGHGLETTFIGLARIENEGWKMVSGTLNLMENGDVLIRVMPPVGSSPISITALNMYMGWPSASTMMA